MQNKFIPCPFCGSSDIKIKNCAGIRIEIHCLNCSCNVSSGFISGRTKDEAEQEAVEKWNTRYNNTAKHIEHFSKQGILEYHEPVKHPVPLTEQEVVKILQVKEDVKRSILPSVMKGDYD